MASSRSTKLSKLKSFRHEEDHDYTYVETFDTIHKQFDRISESSLNYEDGHNFEALHVDSECDFEGFDCNETVNFKEYNDRFLNMMQNLGNNEDEIVLNILELIPKPLEDFHEDKAEETEDIDYFVIEKSSRNGNDMITDSWGFNYSFWRETGGNVKCQNFRCIKRHSKGKTDCPCYLKIYNYNEENMKVSTTGKHNHEPDFALNLKREINMALKRECMDKTLEHPSKVIHNVLTSNKEYMNFYEKGSSLPKMRSMKQTIMRHRNIHAPPKVNDLNFQLEKRFLPDVPNFYRGEVSTKEGRHLIFFSDLQLKYLKDAKAWYVDGTFKIVKDPFTQLLTIHTTVIYNNKTTSIPIAFI